MLIEQDEDGAFVAEVPSLAGCISQGRPSSVHMVSPAPPMSFEPRLRTRVAGGFWKSVRGIVRFDLGCRTLMCQGAGMAKRAIDVKKAEERLAELVDEARRGEDVVLTRNGEPVARIVPIRRAKRARCFGSARGKVVVHPDFDAPLDEFREYM